MDSARGAVKMGGVLAYVSPVPYAIIVALGALGGTALVVAARRNPGPWRIVAARAIGAVLAAVVVSWLWATIAAGTFSAKTSLPVALSNASVVLAAVACWWRHPLLVELTWFWGMAGVFQAVITPDLTSPFPTLEFFQYTIGHVTIVVAAAFLVIGLGIVPRPRAVPRVIVISLLYTGFVGVVNIVTGGNYMFLRNPPPDPTLLDLLGPWPWYLLNATLVGVVLFTLLDLPFWRARRHAGAGREAAESAAPHA
jgi:hypothetical integral membrane protein (TIGR02206 family)